MSTVPFTSQELHDLFRLDEETGEIYWRKRPTRGVPIKLGARAGNDLVIRPSAHCRKTYRLVTINCKTYRRAKIVFCMTRGFWPEKIVDHIDGNSINDRPNNLREATPSQNAQNRKRRTPSELPMGVCRARSGRFWAKIRCNGAPHYLGIFDTPEAASAVYQAKRKVLFGEFA